MSIITVLTIGLNHETTQPVSCTCDLYDEKGFAIIPQNNLHKRFDLVAPENEFEEEIRLSWNADTFITHEATSNITKTSTLVNTNIKQQDGVTSVNLRFTKLIQTNLDDGFAKEKRPISIKINDLSIDICFLTVLRS